jgi:N-(2-amino-2-carboxyethyl)-L-glutamate synthase
MNEGILSTIGNTPLIRLTKIFPDLHFKLYAKLEAFNPAGSTKDRPATNIIRQGMRDGLIGPHTVIVESSSGNMAIGLAQACSYYNLRLICVVDVKTTAQNLKILEAYGAEVDVVSEPDPVSGEFLQARIDRVNELLEIYPDSFWPNQYANVYNPLAHHRTMGEIVSELGEDPDYVFCAVSTCGTMRGCSEYVRQHGLRTKVMAVDAVGSVIWGGPSAKRLIPGHGASIRPRLFRDNLAADCIHVTDLETVVGCRRLAQQEAILSGGSSGAVLMAVDRFREQVARGATCVVIFPDRGERYLDTIYSDKWITEHFGDVTHLWRRSVEEQPCIAMMS